MFSIVGMNVLRNGVGTFERQLGFIPRLALSFKPSTSHMSASLRLTEYDTLLAFLGTDTPQPPHLTHVLQTGRGLGSGHEQGAFNLAAALGGRLKTCSFVILDPTFTFFIYN